MNNLRSPEYSSRRPASVYVDEDHFRVFVMTPTLKTQGALGYI